MLGDSGGDMVTEIFAFYFVLFVVPSQLFKIEIDEIAEIFSPGVESTEDDHVLAHECRSMTASALYGLLVAHFDRSGGPGLQVDEVDGVEANSALPADIVGAHASEDDDEPAFIEDGRMVASGRGDVELFYPGMGIEGVYLSDGEGSTAMPSNYDCQILINRGGVPFSRFRFPPFESVVSGGQKMLNIFVGSLDHRFFDDFSYFGIEGG
jgi:hypothetical protein